MVRIEGMKAENADRLSDQFSLAYKEKDFFYEANVLDELANSFLEKTIL
jgi:hypothetical protein